MKTVFASLNGPLLFLTFELLIFSGQAFIFQLNQLVSFREFLGNKFLIELLKSFAFSSFKNHPA